MGQSKVSKLGLPVYLPGCQQLSLDFGTHRSSGHWAWRQPSPPRPKKSVARSAVTRSQVLLQGQVNLRGSTEAFALLGKLSAAGKQMVSEGLPAVLCVSPAWDHLA